MALVTIPGGSYIPSYPSSIVGLPNLLGTLYVMDAASEGVGPIIRIPKAGTITKVGFMVQTVTTAPTANHDITIEGVSATTGLADGVPIGTIVGGALLNTTGWKLVTLTTTPTVTKGQLVAIRVKSPAVNFGSIGLATFNDMANVGFPYHDLRGAKGVSQSACCTLEYSDGSYAVVEGLFPYSVINSQVFNSSTTPNRRALRFKRPDRSRLAGMWLWAAIANDLDIVLYAANGVTATTLLSIDKDQVGSGSAVLHKLPFDVTQIIEPDTYYRVAIVPTTTLNNTIYDVDVNAAADLDALSGGQGFHLSTANGAPAAEADWTQTLTNRPFMGLWFDQFDDGVGVSGPVGRATIIQNIGTY